jgi:phosphoribosylformylglycinamidine synthase subunit PurS
MHPAEVEPQKFLASPIAMLQQSPRQCGPRLGRRRDMKAKIIITPKKAVLDPQGKTVQTALDHMGYKNIGAVHVGKYLEIELTGSNKDQARQQLDEACHKFLSNPVIEDYRLEIVE